MDILGWGGGVLWVLLSRVEVFEVAKGWSLRYSSKALGVLDRHVGKVIGVKCMRRLLT